VKHLLLAVAAAILLTPSISAQERELAFAMKGEVSASGKFLNVRAELGTGVTRAIRVYSEPSHTLLGVFVSNNVEDEKQRNWRDENLAGVGRVMEFPFQEKATAMLQMHRAPASDTAIQMIVFGSWPDGKEEERPVTVNTKVDKFAFAYATTAGNFVKLCCGTGLDGCARACTTCTDAGNLTCCTLQVADPNCGWCGKNEASCVSKSCPC
jgi:hypothetical protein